MPMRRSFPLRTTCSWPLRTALSALLAFSTPLPRNLDTASVGVSPIPPIPAVVLHLNRCVFQIAHHASQESLTVVHRIARLRSCTISTKMITHHTLKLSPLLRIPRLSHSPFTTRSTHQTYLSQRSPTFRSRSSSMRHHSSFLRSKLAKLRPQPPPALCVGWSKVRSPS